MSAKLVGVDLDAPARQFTFDRDGLKAAPSKLGRRRAGRPAMAPTHEAAMAAFAKVSRLDCDQKNQMYAGITLPRGLGKMM